MSEQTFDLPGSSIQGGELFLLRLSLCHDPLNISSLPLHPKVVAEQQSAESEQAERPAEENSNRVRRKEKAQ